MHSGIRGIATLIAVAAAVGAGPASAKTFNLTFAAAQGLHLPWVGLTQSVFIAGVDRRLKGTDHKIDWTKAYGGTLSKVGGTLETIEEGIADAGIVYSLFEQAKLPLQNVAYMAPFGSDSLGLTLRVFQELHQEVPEMSGSWEKHGQVFVAPIGFDTFYPLTKFPIKSLKDLDGRKLAGAGAVSLWEAPIGIVPVQGNFSVHFNNLKTGVYDGLIAFTTGYYPNKLHEIARYATKVNFGAMPGGAVTINKGVWAKLPGAVKKAMNEAALDYRDAQDKTMTRLVETFEAKMAKEGTVFSQMPLDQKLAWAKAMPNIAKEWAARAEAKGFAGNKVLKAYMDKLRANKVPLVRQWDKE